VNRWNKIQLCNLISRHFHKQ